MEVQRLTSSTGRIAHCGTRVQGTKPHVCRKMQVGRQIRRQFFSLATAEAVADAVAEAPAVRQTDEEAAKGDDDFPEQSPEEIAELVQTDKYAVIEIGGVQMFVQEGRWYNCNRLEAEPGQTIQLGRVLAVKNDGKFEIGDPYVEGAVVKAEIVEDLKGPKLTIFKMNRKKHYRRKTGHRQPLTQFYITEITP